MAKKGKSKKNPAKPKREPKPYNVTAATRLKGGKLKNRYKIVGKLTTLSPLHIGDGLRQRDENRVPIPRGETQAPEFSTVATDYKGVPYLPGSTLKGNLRNWLTQLFSADAFKGRNIAAANNGARATDLQRIYEDLKARNNIDDAYAQINAIEFLFGSALNEGKLEFWDAPMDTPPPAPETGATAFCGYSVRRGTTIVTSVAIDPETGTAAKNKLYNIEVVPPGATFTITISGQNLGPADLGMVLFALNGFKSTIFPVTLGAMGGVGFGRCAFQLTSLHLLDEKNFDAWLKDAVANDHAGYTKLEALSKAELDRELNDFKDRFKQMLASPIPTPQTDEPAEEITT